MIPQEMFSDLEVLQDTVLGRIVNDAAFASIVVLDEKKGITDTDLAQTLASNTVRGGKKGACIIVCTPFFDVPDERTVGPRIEPKIYVRCIERPMVNRGLGGANVTAEQMAINVTRLLHFYLIGGLNVCLEASKGDPINWEKGEREFTVTIKTSLQLRPFAKVANVILAKLSSTSCSLACATAGAAIYYTVDGSFPAPGNPTAILVTGDLETETESILTTENSQPLLVQVQAAVITVAAGTFVRAVAYSPTPTTQVASDLAAQLIS